MTLKYGFALGVTLAAFAFSQVAHAGDNQDFAGCDGLKAPTNKNFGISPFYERIGIFSPYAKNVKGAKEVIMRCTSMLTSPKLAPEHSLRRANLLRARAAASIIAGQTDLAIHDLEEIRKILEPFSGDMQVERSLLASVDMLHAIALYEEKRFDEAAILSEQAAQRRPYYYNLQFMNALIRMQGSSGIAALRADFSQAQKLHPAMGLDGILKSTFLNRGDFQNYLELASDANVTWVSKETALSQAEKLRWVGPKIFGTAANEAVTVAYAHAANGNAEMARSRLDEFAGQLQQYIDYGQEQSGPGSVLALQTDISRKLLMPSFSAAVNARIALSEGDSEEAIRLAGEARLIPSSIRRDLVSLLGEGNVAEFPLKKDDKKEGDAAADRDPTVVDVSEFIPTMLLHLETDKSTGNFKPRAVNPKGGFYPMSRGYSSAETEDGNVEISFEGIGGDMSVKKEMAALRAAQIALEKGFPAFVIENASSEKDGLFIGMFQRKCLNCSAKFTVSFVDDIESNPRALSAADVIANLAPMYLFDDQEP